MTDTCLKCGETKPVADFCKSSQAKRGYILHCKSCERLRARNKRRMTPESARAATLRSKYGITQEVYGQLRTAQGNVCRICRVKPPGKELAVDHCHRTGIIRGLLCQPCNTALGMFKDDPSLLREAANYLEMSKAEMQPEEPNES